MERIDLFDRYIKNQLSVKELSDFNETLKSDKDFAEEFKIYLLCVDGIIKEAQQDDIEFGHAMKAISKAELMKIVGKKVDFPVLEECICAAEIVLPAFSAPIIEDECNSEKSRTKRWNRKLIVKIAGWSVAAGIVAIIIGGAVFVNYAPTKNHYANDGEILYHMETSENLNSRDVTLNDLDDAIFYAMVLQHENSVRGGNVEYIDINSLDENEVKENLSDIERNYYKSSEELDIAENGTLLVMAYLRLHQRENAKKILNELINKFQENPDFQGDVSDWKKILKLIK